MNPRPQADWSADFPLGALPASWFILVLISIVTLCGCRTLPPLPPADLSAPGWRVQQGQAVWKPRRTAPEIAGEIVLATHPDGRSVVQFTKTPFNIVVAQMASNRWQIQFVPEHRLFGGAGQPPKYFCWLHLAAALAAEPLPKGLTLSRSGDSQWRLENRATGETIEGYFLP
jgi:hypothetical protein